MTLAEIAELERLLAAYRTSRRAGLSPPNIGRARRRLETSLVQHADALIAAAKARQVGEPIAKMTPAPPMADWPEEER